MYLHIVRRRQLSKLAGVAEDSSILGICSIASHELRVVGSSTEVELSRRLCQVVQLRSSHRDSGHTYHGGYQKMHGGQENRCLTEETDSKTTIDGTEENGN